MLSQRGHGQFVKVRDGLLLLADKTAVKIELLFCLFAGLALGVSELALQRADVLLQIRERGVFKIFDKIGKHFCGLLDVSEFGGEASFFLRKRGYIVTSVAEFSFSLLQQPSLLCDLDAQLFKFRLMLLFKPLFLPAKIRPVPDQFAARRLALGELVHELLDRWLVLLEFHQLLTPRPDAVIVVTKKLSSVERGAVWRYVREHQQTVAHLLLRDGT